MLFQCFCREENINRHYRLYELSIISIIVHFNHEFFKRHRKPRLFLRFSYTSLLRVIFHVSYSAESHDENLSISIKHIISVDLIKLLHKIQSIFEETKTYLAYIFEKNFWMTRVKDWQIRIFFFRMSFYANIRCT